jgi:hypothetical protein
MPGVRAVRGVRKLGCCGVASRLHTWYVQAKCRLHGRVWHRLLWPPFRVSSLASCVLPGPKQQQHIQAVIQPIGLFQLQDQICTAGLG